MTATEPKPTPKPVKRAPKKTSIEELTVDEWLPRLQQMRDGEWYDATESWGVTKVDSRTINQVLWNHLRNKDNPDDPGLRIVCRREKLTNKVKDPKTGAITPATYSLLVRLVSRGKMLELELDDEAERRRSGLR